MADLRQRDPRHVESDYKGWIAQLPCVACMTAFGKLRFGVHVAHCRITNHASGWRPVGMAEKPHDRRCTPLCHVHHQNGDRNTAQHKMAEEVFWDEKLGIDVFALVAALSDAYDRRADGVAVIVTFAARGRKVLNERAMAA